MGRAGSSMTAAAYTGPASGPRPGFIHSCDKPDHRVHVLLADCPRAASKLHHYLGRTCSATLPQLQVYFPEALLQHIAAWRIKQLLAQGSGHGLGCCIILEELRHQRLTRQQIGSAREPGLHQFEITPR